MLMIIISMFSVGCNCGRLVLPWGFFCKETLRIWMIPDLPQLSHGLHSKTSYNTFECNLSEEEFHQYVEKVYEYLKRQNFAYLGYEGELLFDNSGVPIPATGPTYQLMEGCQLSDFYQSEYSVQFIWGNRLIEQTVLDWRSMTITYDRDASEYNLRMTLLKLHYNLFEPYYYIVYEK